MYRKITGELLTSMLEAARINLFNHREELNKLNVFPVPDGDTGTNMSLTFTVAANAAKNHSETASSALSAVSMAALRGARGNSGVILSQLLRGMAMASKGCDELTVEVMCDAFLIGSKTAYAAIMKPTEGTILTVFRMMAEHLDRMRDEITDFEILFSEAVKSANDALSETPEMLPKLKQAGVVDSGGKGVVYIIEGLADYFNTGIMPEQFDVLPEEKVDPSKIPHDPDEVKFTYCTEFIILNNSNKKVELTKRYEALGDCIVVIADEDIVKVHIHTNSPGIIISEALKIGPLIDIKIDNMKHQNENLANTQEKPAERQPFAFVSVASGEGFVSIFKELGINYFVSGGQSMNPSSDDILMAANNTNAEVVYVFPNNKNIILAAEQAAELYDGRMVVIPTKNMSDVLSCMVVFSEDEAPEANFEAMTEVLSGIKSIQVTYSVRDSVFDDIEIKEGEIMSLSGSTLLAKGKDINKAVISSIDKLKDSDVSIITVYAGCDVNGDDSKKLEEMLNKKFKDVDFAFYRGDQPVYYYLVSME